MGLFTYAKIEHDFPGGIYLPPLAQVPALDRIEPLDYAGDLYLPLSLTGTEVLETVVETGQHVRAHELLARGGLGQYVYAPVPGKAGDQRHIFVQGRPGQPALTFHPDGPSTPPVEPSWPESAETASVSASVVHQKPEVWQAIERAGLVLPETARPLAALLQTFEHQKITTVVANATPLEPSLNAPLAILQHYPEQVFTGLAILKRWLGASEAILAYPHHFPLDTTAAEHWQVKCLPVSDKYPQGRPNAILQTLIKQGHLKRKKLIGHPPVVFDIQLLRQVERCLFTGSYPATSRIVTVCGDGVEHPRHILAPVGTPLRVLLHHAGMYRDTEVIVEGSSLAGVSIDPDTTVVTQTSQSLIAIRSTPRHHPDRCIRCGWCLEYCPARIDPARLLQMAENAQWPLAAQIGLDQCIECGICSYICPSHLRLMENIRLAKRMVHPKPQTSPEIQHDGKPAHR